jgi:hypothetical protein
MKIAAILLMVLAGTEGVFYISLQTNYGNLNSEYKELKTSFAELESLYTDLNTSYCNLEFRWKELAIDHSTLEDHYDSLEAIYHYLQNSHDSLQSSYDYIQRRYEVERALRIGNSLESYYDYLRQELGPTGVEEWWWSRYSESRWQTQVDFAANLALHDLRRIYWPAIEEDYYEDVGEYSYDTARRKIDDILGLLEVRTYDTASVKTRKILEFVSLHIHYETEVNDVFLAPVETLGFKSGDCDDFTILTAALLEDMGIDSAIGFFSNENDEYHAMVLVHLEGLVDYGYWYFSDLTHRDLDEGRWIIIEPQLTIEDQGDDWISQWDLLVAADLE